jgi:alanyl-tRNA synthetase
MENKGKNRGWDNLKPCKPGETANPNGRPKGQRNYATIYREALAKIADSKGMTPEEIETMMEEVGLKQGLKGNFAFWKDIRDRIHGKAQETQVVKGELKIEVSKESAERYGLTQTTTRDSE